MLVRLSFTFKYLYSSFMKSLFRRFWLGLLLLIGWAVPVHATHIVGGEFGLTYVKRGQYDLRLTLYFDAINGSIGAIDTAVRVFIFPKRPGSTFSKEIIMQLDPDIEFVAYSNPDCQFTDGAVRTRILSYVKRINLPPDQFADTLGYYVVWERCCRNGTITNIMDPGSTGQTFYLEFPSIRRGAGPADTLKNSSPTLFKPLSDFACVNQPFEFDFSGLDPDGDSLVYGMVPPFAGNTTANNPGQYPTQPAPPLAEPYDPVTWAPGFSNAIQINGARPIGIDARTGVLRMTAGRTGLFVFAIECREYRRGKLLGRVRREFQVFVRDCPRNTPPRIALRDSSGRQLGNGDTLVIWQKPDGNRCYTLNIGDSIPDTEVLSVVAPQLGNGVSLTQDRGNTTRGVFSTQLCFDDCLALTATRYARLTLRVRDNFCSIPARDSLKIVVTIKPLVPDVNALGQSGFSPIDTTLSIGPGYVEFLVADSVYNVSASAFLSPDIPGGVTVTPLGGTARRQRYRVNFSTPCVEDTLPFYTLTLVGKVSRCNLTYTDTIRMRFSVYRRPVQTTLSLRDSLGQLYDGHLYVVNPRQRLRIRATGTVTDGSNVSVSAEAGYAPATSGIQSRSGNSPQTLDYTWAPTCADLAALDKDSLFTLRFMAEAVDCVTRKTDLDSIQVLVRDTVGGSVRVGNIITVNDDGANDAFRLWDPMPLENCDGKFEGVDIYDRWGKRIYHSDDISFAWKPNEGKGSLYFYRLVFQGKQYRGWVETVIGR